jgi:hypothetical protein
MRGLVVLVVLACAFAPVTDVQAQRRVDGLAGIPPVTRDTTRGRSREAVFVQRAAVATLANGVVLAPTALLYRATKSEMVLFTGIMTQLVITPFAAAMIGSNAERDCGVMGRVALAFGGALMGLGGSILFSEERYQREHPHEHDDRALMRPAGVTALAIGVPLGAAAALYDCR